MEFHEKLQALRRQKNVTQEALAEQLFVSRTAVSKWESGRGYPNIESLKALARFYAVSVDELLSGDELLSVAEADARQAKKRCRDLVFGLLDLSAAMFFFLPFFGQTTSGGIEAVSLPSLSEISPWLKGCFYTSVIAMSLWGIVALALQNCGHRLWEKSKSGISMALGGASVLLFIVCSQPYAAALLFLFLVIKALVLNKQR